MSHESDAGDTGALESAYRTVSPPYGPHAEPEMNLIGWIVFLGALTLLFPLVPFVLLLLGIGKLLEILRRR